MKLRAHLRHDCVLVRPGPGQSGDHAAPETVALHLLSSVVYMRTQQSPKSLVNMASSHQFVAIGE